MTKQEEHEKVDAVTTSLLKDRADRWEEERKKTVNLSECNRQFIASIKAIISLSAKRHRKIDGEKDPEQGVVPVIPVKLKEIDWCPGKH